MKVLITGGAGYVGTTLIPVLLEQNFEVRVFDNLLYGGNVLLPFIRDKHFEFFHGDIRDSGQVAAAMLGMDVIIHLAAIVGYGACRKDPGAAYDINSTGTTNVVKSKGQDQYLIFASTGSNYGSLDEICTEESMLNPLSIYAKTKVAAEQIVESSKNYTIFRFATAFGVSPRLRLDLLVNELTYLAATQNYLVVYEKDFMRTFIHVRDMAEAFLFAIMSHIDKEPMIDQIYNVGSDRMNLSKEGICDIIKKKTPAYIHYTDYDNDADKRDYIVSYDKISKLGYDTVYSVEEGITELIDAFGLIETKNKYKNS